jgi:predicted alpha-1,2-mannosidase
MRFRAFAFHCDANHASPPVSRIVQRWTSRVLLCLALSAASWAVVRASSATDSVNVFTGTSNSRWMLFPGATRPFGLVKLSPDNQLNVWNGGYEYTVGSISGFSHLHAYVLSGVSLMPVTGPMEYNPGLFRVFPGSPDGPFGTMWTSGYRSRMRRDTERGAPGYYAVDLTDWGVHVEATATMRTGALRLTYPATREAHLLLDFAFPTEELCRIIDAAARQTGPAEITGHIRQSNNYTGEYTVHFVIRASRPFASLDAWQRQPFTGSSNSYGTDWQTPVEYRRGVTEFSGHDGCGVVMNFDTTDERVVTVNTGLSLVSEAGARANLEVETKASGGKFDAIAAEARASWEDRLGSIEVSGGSADARAMFYTCLYRAFSAKSVVSDADGTYLDHTTGTIGRLRGGEVYSSDALWGAQWTLFPLWTLTSPAVARSWVNFLVESAQRNGWIPEAPVLGGYAPVMVAQHQQALIVSSFQKGIRGFDAERAFAAIKHDLTTPGRSLPNRGYAGDRQLADYMTLGFVPHEAGPTSNTFEYAYDDWVAAQFARALGHEDDYRTFAQRARNFLNNLDPETKWARPRHRDGTWVTPFDVHHFGTEGGWNGPGFVEGNGWLYTWFVPQDPAALVGFLGRAEFNRRLEEGFDKGYVDIGNETNLQAPFLFNYSGKPWLTQRYVREALATAFDTSPVGGWLKGEEDEGQLSALYVLWSMGLFEMDGGCSVRPYYDLATPQFDRIVLHLDRETYGGKTFTIETHHNGPKNVYIQSAQLNGQPLTRAWIYHDELVAGGTLTLELGAEPNLTWGTRPHEAAESAQSFSPQTGRR